MSAPRPAAAAGVVTRNVGGEVVLVPTNVDVAQFDNVFLLSKVAAFIWQNLDGTRDRDELCQLVRSRYDVPAAHDVGADVDGFLAELTRRGLLGT